MTLLLRLPDGSRRIQTKKLVLEYIIIEQMLLPTASNLFLTFDPQLNELFIALGLNCGLLAILPVQDYS